MNRVIFKLKKIIFFLRHNNFRNKNIILFGIPIIVANNRLEIGRDLRINQNVFVHAEGGVNIGDNVTLSYGTTILSVGYDLTDWRKNCHSKKHLGEKIVIKSNTWICANVTILPGSFIPEGSVVLPGSIVKGTFDKEYSMYGGIPAKFIKEL